jgi:hypothetical protein
VNLYEQAAQMIEDLYDSNHPDHTAETVMALTEKLREASKASDENIRTIGMAAGLLGNVVDNIDRIGGLDEIKPNALGEYDRAAWLLKNSMINVRAALKWLRAIVPSNE